MASVISHSESRRLRSVIICHEGSDLNRIALAGWLGSFTDLVGIVVIREGGGRTWNRVKKEIGRVGLVRFLDVSAFRIYYRLAWSGKDQEWERNEIRKIKEKYGMPPAESKELIVHSPNVRTAREFIAQLQPDIVIARCKFILKESVFSIPTIGTFVMHPGICPEYRNSHGCFWALAEGDIEKVGMTLLKIDKGIDTGPVYGYFTYAYDSLAESHFVIQTRVVVDNLDDIRDRLLEISAGKAATFDTSDRESGVWGQPWLTKYISWKRRARKFGK